MHQKTFVGVLWENLGFRSYTEVEKAVVLTKLKTQSNLDESQLIRDFLPRLGLRADRYHLEKSLKIARLPESLQRAITYAGLRKNRVYSSVWSNATI